MQYLRLYKKSDFTTFSTVIVQISQGGTAAKVAED
jgi:hypothetical protein